MIISTTTNLCAKIKALIYGPSGAGKTTTARTLPNKTLIISSEAGLLCLAGLEKPMDVIDISLDDNGEIVPKEKRIHRLGEAYKFLLTKECQDKYDNIFIDSLTEISQNLMDALYAEFPDRKDSLVMYGENAKRLRSLVKMFRDLPFYNVIFTALSSTEKDEMNKRYTGVSIVGKLGQSLPAFFDEVFYLATIEDENAKSLKRVFITQSTESYICKDRSGKLDRVEPADLTIVLNKIIK